MAHNPAKLANCLYSFFTMNFPNTIQKTKPKVNMQFTTAVAKALP